MPKRKAAKRKKSSVKRKKPSSPKALRKQDRPRVNGQGMSSGSRATQFKPGQSGNPGGRGKGSVSLMTLMRRAVNSPYTGDDAKPGQTKADKMMENAVDLAAKGSHKHLITLLERLLGKVPDRVHVDNNPLSSLSDEDLQKLLDAEETGEEGGADEQE